ncbi:hypothetical protein FLA_0360 [Filimonas lacunae]|nr:hypothetical protein FLA_0360 [Filimonas lacunae]
MVFLSTMSAFAQNYKITGFYPKTGTIGQYVIISGTFPYNVATGDTIKNVAFGGVNATAFRGYYSDSLIEARVGQGATGRITLTLPDGSVISSTDTFRYQQPSPTLYYFTPTSGKAGDTINIYGQNLTNVYAVQFGGVAARSFSVANAGLIKAVVGAGASGNVTVYGNNGSSTLGGFAYSTNAPVTDSVYPRTGYLRTEITICGHGFSNATNVAIGNKGRNVESFYVVSDSIIKAKVGYGNYGPVYVTTTSGTDTLQRANFYLWGQINSFSPLSGKKGTVVTLHGVFTVDGPAVNVTFGGTNAASFTQLNDSTINAVVGEGSSGGVTVYSHERSGFSGGQSFTFIDSANEFVPAIYSFSPTSGGIGDTIWIYGKKLNAVYGASFGASYSQGVYHVNDSLLFVVITQATSGAVTVYSNNGKASAIGFTYIKNLPVVNSIWPSKANVGDTVLIHGSRFTGTRYVVIGNYGVEWFRELNDSIIQVVIRNGNYGKVTVSNYDGEDTLKRAYFTLLPKITSFTPQSGGKGAFVAIRGLFPTPVGAEWNNKLLGVTFGGVKAISYQLLGDSLIYANVGEGATGLVKVILTDSVSGFSVDTFRYEPQGLARIDYFAPDKARSGDTVIIHGKGLRNAYNAVFGGVYAARTFVINDSIVKAVVGAGATGFVEMVLPDSTIRSGQYFTYVDSASAVTPHIYRFTPDSAKTGDTVTIYGSGFQYAERVLFGGVDIVGIGQFSDSVLQVVVGLGASGVVEVVTSFGVARDSGFVYLGYPPAIVDFTPKYAYVGDTVLITGTHFNGTSQVRLDGYYASSYTVLSDSVISAVVGSYSVGSDSLVAVISEYGTGLAYGMAVSGTVIDTVPQNYPPVIVDFTPKSGHAGDTVLITGAHFSNINQVRLGGYYAYTSTVLSDSVIRAIVGSYGAGFDSFLVVVGNTYGIDTAYGFTYLGTVIDTVPNNTDTLAKAAISNYPNPAINSTTVKHPAIKEKAVIMLYNMNGVLVQVQSVNPGDVQTTLYFSSVPKGMYKIIWTNGKVSKSSTVIIQ